MARPKDIAWQKIFDDYNIGTHNFSQSPFEITAAEIKKSCQDFTTTGSKEVRVLCTQTDRALRPTVFVKHNLFLLPIKNGVYAILQGEGYIDIPPITKPVIPYESKLSFPLETSKVGDSEMQHLDYAYATSLIRSFMDDDSLVLTIRGRKYTPDFSFNAGEHGHTISVTGVQTEVDAGYEGKDKVLLIEAKNFATDNVIIRQLYYPFLLWRTHTAKTIYPVFFEKREKLYCIWQFGFDDVKNYNSIRLIKSARFAIS